MGKLNYKPREIVRALEGKLSIEFREGPERIGWYILDGRKEIRFKVPHVHSSWGKGTIHDIITRSKLNKDEFRELVDCPIDGTRYEELIRQRMSSYRS